MTISKIIYNNSLRTLVDGLFDQLRAIGYSETTLDNYMSRLRPIQTFMQQNGVNEYLPEVGQKYYEYYIQTHKPGKILRREVHAHITRLNDYYNGVPFSVHHVTPGPDTIPDCFLASTEEYFEACFKSGYTQKTVNRKKRGLARFLTKCHICGINRIGDLIPQSVLLSCKDVNDTDEWLVIQLFLRFLAEQGKTKTDLSTFVPLFNREKKLPTTYSIEEIHDLEAAVDRSTLIGKRDYTMILLADRLGIRAGDIVSIKYENLDFIDEKISFIQKKTGDEITLTMVPDVKNALIDYLQQEPVVTEGIIFRKIVAPHGSIKSLTVFDTVNKYFKRAGINTTGKKHGPHTLRASLSTSMVNDDVPYEVVRSILGHKSKDSIKHYAKTDIDKLRRCAISVPIPSGNFQKFLQEVHN